MRKPLPSLLVLFLMLFAAWLPVKAQGKIHFQDDFEGEPSPLWDLEPGWEFLPEGGSTVLKGEGHSWARLDLPLDGDFAVSFRLKVIQGRLHLISHNNALGRYYTGIGSEQTQFNKQYYPDTFLESLAAGQPAPGGAWMDVSYTSEGNILRLYINGEQQFTYQDDEPLDQGGIAFETLEDSRVLIDDLVITYLEGPAEQENQVEEETAELIETSGWIRTGGPLGGLGYDVRMAPDNPDLMYVTDAFAGVFISKDGGDSWYPSNQGITDRTGESMDAIPVFCLTISPHDSQEIWVGTQFSGGLFRSEDGGKSWTKKTNGLTIQDGLTFRGITIDPNDPEVIFAAGEISSWAWAGKPINGREFDLTQGILFKSENGGESWKEVWRGNNLARYIWINPQDTDIVYLSTGIFDREAANSDPQARIPGGEGVLKSTDGGETWSKINNGLDNLYVGSLYMHPQNPDILLAGTGNNQYYEGGGIYLTTNGGSDWQQVYDARGGNINSVEFSETQPDIAYAGNPGEILRSQDGGQSWAKMTPSEDGWGSAGVRGGFPIDFQLDPRDPERIFANNYGGGNFLSEDGGLSWKVASSGYTGAQARSLAVDPAHPGLIYSAARSGIFKSPNGGDSWIGLAKKPFQVLEWNAVAVDPGNPDHLLSANNWVSVILTSSDGGATWKPADQSPPDNTWIRIIKFAPSDPRQVYAGTSSYVSAGVFSPELPANGIYGSSDGGATWEQLTAGSYSDAHVMDLAVGHEDHEIVYAASSNYGVLKSTDMGSSWQQINQGLVMNRGASAVAVHPDDRELVYVGIAFGGVYRSQDGGSSWQQTSAGLNPEANISDLVIDPTNPDVMYASDLFSGVYRSLNAGQSWEKFSQGLRMRSVNQLALSEDGGHLYAATEGEGVYRYDLTGQPPEEVDLIIQEDQTSEEDRSAEETEAEVEESQEMDGESEEQPAPQTEDDRSETEAQRQFCPGSYLPLVLGLIGLGSINRKQVEEKKK